MCACVCVRESVCVCVPGFAVGVVARVGGEVSPVPGPIGGVRGPANPHVRPHPVGDRVGHVTVMLGLGQGPERCGKFLVQCGEAAEGAHVPHRGRGECEGECECECE